MLNLLYILTGLAALSSTAALPTVSNDISLTPTPNTITTDPLVTVTIYSESQCGGNNATYALDANVCYDFGDGVQALRVGAHDEALRYNSRKSCPANQLCERDYARDLMGRDVMR